MRAVSFRAFVIDVNARRRRRHRRLLRRLIVVLSTFPNPHALSGANYTNKRVRFVEIVIHCCRFKLQII